MGEMGEKQLLGGGGALPKLRFLVRLAMSTSTGPPNLDFERSKYFYGKTPAQGCICSETNVPFIR